MTPEACVDAPIAPEYCPRCQAVQPLEASHEESRSVLRCHSCGFPVKPGLLLESHADLNASKERDESSGDRETAPVLPPSADLSIPTRLRTVTLVCVHGETIQGRMFLRLTAEGHAGPETLWDRLNGPEVFLPLQVDEAPVVFVNKTQILRVEAAPEDALPARTEGLVSTAPVALTLVNGDRLTGELRIEGPPGSRRLSDVLNTQPGFLALCGAERTHLLQTRLITLVSRRPS